MPDDVLGAEQEELTKQRERLEPERRALEESEARTIDLSQLSLMLPVATQRLRQWVPDASGQDMDLIPWALEVQIRASHERVQIEGAVPATVPEAEDLVTIERTSA